MKQREVAARCQDSLVRLRAMSHRTSLTQIPVRYFSRECSCDRLSNFLKKLQLLLKARILYLFMFAEFEVNVYNISFVAYVHRSRRGQRLYALQKLTAKDEAIENWHHRAPNHAEKREYCTSAAKSAARA